MHNKKRKSKLISSAVALLLILVMIASCGGNDNKESPNNAQNQNAAENQTENQEETTEERILPDIPQADYNGHVYNILTFGVQGSYEWEQNDLTSEGETGDIIGDAVYKRNRAVEEKYNVTIKEVHKYDSDFGNSLKKEIGAGTHEFDLISPRLVDSASYMQSGYFMNLFGVPNIDLEKPWYNQQGIAEMSIDNKLFIVMSDILLSDNNATSITVFNKQMIKDYGLEDPYALVKEGKWTVDKLYEMAKAAARDVNGDGQMTPDADNFGYLIWGDAMVTYLHAGGQMLVSKDENDLPYLAFNNPKTYEIMDKAIELLYDGNVTGNVQKTAFTSYSDVAFEDIFTSDRAAFGWVRLYMIPRLRSMDTDFGILPTPKIYESADTVYPSTVNVHTACALAIPVTVEDIERTTVIMEALAAESKYTLQPAYYDISLKTKYSRDDDSSDMLDIILSNTVIDIGDVYNFAEFGIEFYRLSINEDRNLVSFYEKYESKVNKEIDKLITKFEGLE